MWTNFRVQSAEALRFAAFLATVACLLAAGCARNEPPAISVGPDLNVDAGGRVTLTGEATDPEGSAVAYRWQQLEGEPVELRNVERPNSTFIAPAVEVATTLTFRLTATDDSGTAATADTTVTVEPYGSLNVALSGTVRNHATHAPIPGASVTVNQFGDDVPHRVGDTQSDADGGYAVEVPASPGRLTVHAEADGFAAQSAVVTVLEETTGRSVHLDMVPVQAVREFVAAEGADVSVDGQSVVTLPANAMTTGDGSAYTGRAVASVAVLDPSQDPSTMPGDFQSWNTDSQTAAPIESYGAVSVDLRADDGAPLQLTGADVAELSIPLANGRSPQDAPPTMPLYYWSEELGYWIEEGEARLEQVSGGNWAYVGSVGHFSTWNADAIYESVSLTGCVNDANGNPVAFAEVTARGIDYTGTSSTTANDDGRFEIDVRPESELELVAVSDEDSAEAATVRSAGEDTALNNCLVVLGEVGLSDFPVRIEGETGTIDICVRDHECEDGDAIDVDVDGRNVFSGEIVNEAMCSALEVEAGRDYVIELTALNGTGFKGACNFADVNTGEIVVRGLNTETQVWRHREGAGSRARIVVTAGMPQPLSIVPTPPDATVRFVANASRGYEPGMELLAGDYRVEVSAPGYESREVTVAHGADGPTILEVALERLFEPGEVFADALASGGQGPEMVVIPAGRFRMGDLTGDSRFSDGSSNELPPRTVIIARKFAIGRFEVSLAEYNSFLAAVGRTQRETSSVELNHPVFEPDRLSYLEWLSQETGEVYRLPTEEEWEYSARARTDTNFYWGNDPSGKHANGDNFHFYHGGTTQRQITRRWGLGRPWPNDGWPRSGEYGPAVAPVGSYPPNAFGLYDMIGNAMEPTVCDYNESDWRCTGITYRGGGAFDRQRVEDMRVSARQRYAGDDVGLRVLREIR